MSPPDHDETRDVEARITRHLRGLLRIDDTPPTPPPWYLRRHLAEHAAAGACLTADLLAPPLLPYLDNTRLRASLDRSSPSPPLSAISAVLRSVAHVWNDNEPSANAAALALWSGPGQETIGNLWRVTWSHWRPHHHHQILTGHTSPVVAVATAVLPDGRVVAVTGSHDDTVRVWDLATGTPPGDPLTGHTSPVVAVATAVLPDGRVVAVTGCHDRTVRVWDLATGTPPGDPLTGHTRPVAAAATAALPDGRVVAVTASWDHTVRVWDLATGTPLGDPLTGHTSPVEAVATAVLPDGRVVAVTGCHDRTVRVWDLATGTPPGDPLTGHTRPVAAVATAALPDGRVVAVTASWDRTVRVWDLAIMRLLPMTQPLPDIGSIAVQATEDGVMLVVATGPHLIRFDMPALSSTP